MFAVATAPLWLLSVSALAALLHVGECVYEVPPPQHLRPQSAPADYYSQGMRAAFADALTNGADEAMDEDDESLQELLLGGAAEKRVKPSLSISNSLDVLRQKVMLEFVRRQLRENIKQIEMNRAHLNSIGKRGGATPTGSSHSTSSNNAKESVELERPTWQHNTLQHNDLYRMAALHYQQQQQQQSRQRQQPQPLIGNAFLADLD